MTRAGRDHGDEPRSIIFTGDEGLVLTGEVIDPDEAILPPASGSTPQVPPIAIGQILEAVPDVLRAVHGGKIMRVIGGPSGPLWQVDGGVLATVRGDKGIVGHLRFAGAPEDVRLVAAPAAAFQIASAVTLQYYLNTITKQLESLQRGIGSIKEWLAADARAELEGAERSCSDIARHLAAGTSLREADLVKLNEAHNVGRRRFAAARTRLEALAAHVDDAVTETGDIRDRGKLKQALTDATNDGVRDYQDLMRAAVLTVQALALLASHDAKVDVVRLETTRDAALDEIEEMRSTLGQLSGCLNKLNIRKSASGGKRPDRELEAYRVASKDLRRILRQPSDHLVPMLVAASPWIIEARASADGSIETRVQQLELSLRPDSSS